MLQFSHEANLPNAICKQCHEQVESSYTFRKRCQGSYRKLQSHLQALKNKKCAELESGFDESLKERNNSDEEKLVLNFEKDGVAELVNYTPVDVGVFNEVFIIMSLLFVSPKTSPFNLKKDFS